MTPKLREEQPGDEDAIRRVNREAFGQPQEAQLVDRLRSSCPDHLSLVAVDGDEVVGHILFSPVELSPLTGMGLGPMAVLPGRQRSGIGSKLVREGIERLRRSGCSFVVVLGHADYYPRFDFEPASRHGVHCEWDVPDEVFMMLVLDAPSMEGVSGLARYRSEFQEVT